MLLLSGKNFGLKKTIVLILPFWGSWGENSAVVVVSLNFVPFVFNAVALIPALMIAHLF